MVLLVFKVVHLLLAYNEVGRESRSTEYEANLAGALVGWDWSEFEHVTSNTCVYIEHRNKTENKVYVTTCVSLNS